MARAIEVEDAGAVEVDEVRADSDEAVRRARYGGFNFGAGFFGWIVAVGISVLLTALLSAFGSIVALTTPAVKNNNLTTSSASTIGIVGGILLLIALAVAYFAGGYVAGRMSRFDGARQGFGVWLIGVIIMIILALLGLAFGSSYNLLQQVHVPSIPINAGTLTAGGLITLIAVVVVTLVTAILGGIVGQNYHTKVDRAVE